MKKRKSLTFLLLITVFCCSLIFGFGLINPVQAMAAGVDYSSPEDGDFDSSLFNVVRTLAAELNGGGGVSGFNATIFKDDYKSIDYATASVDAKKIIDDLNQGILNLTTGDDAAYTRLKTMKIKDIEGLNSLDLSNIKTLILDNNAISRVAAADFETLLGVNVISMQNCGLDYFTLNPELERVNELRLSNNNLTEIDLSKMYTLTGQRPRVDLSNNKISAIGSINFGAKQFASLDLSFNNLQDVDVDTLSLNMYNGAKPEILVQGVSDLGSLKAGDKFTVYQSNEIANFKVKFSYADTSDFYVSGGDNVICQTTGTEAKESVYIPAGRIAVEFFSGENPINEVQYPKLKKQNCNIKLSAPTIQTIVDDKVVDQTTVSTDIKIKFVYENIDLLPNKDDILSSTNKVQIFSKIDESDDAFKQNEELLINQNGDYTIKVYAYFDGLYSETAELKVVRRDMTGIIIGILIVVAIFVVCGAIYFIGRWIREGAVVAPLSEKEILRLKRSREKKGYLVDDYISKFEQPRHDDRVSDLGYSDNDLTEDLNKADTSYQDEESSDVEVDVDANIEDIKDE